MRTMMTKLGLALGLMMVGPAVVRAADLKVGDPAPPLTVAKFVKGEKVDKLEKGQIYVVEFWATWCPPCRATIPHLTKLQKEYPAVTFIGVSILENEPAKVEPFVKEMGDKMDYRVAIDDTSSGDGKMAEAWFQAAKQDGIPCAFIVGKTGAVAWIGHPAAMGKPLGKIVAGNYDPNEEKATQEALAKVAAKVQPLSRNTAKNGKEILEILDEAFAKHTSLEDSFASLKFEALFHTDREAASAYGNKLVDTIYKDDESVLNLIAWTIIDPDTKIDDSKRDVKLALRAAQRAVDLGKGENGEILDTLALATFLSGDAAKAYQIQEKAVKLTPEKNPEMIERLEKYKKAAGK